MSLHPAGCGCRDCTVTALEAALVLLDTGRTALARRAIARIAWQAREAPSRPSPAPRKVAALPPSSRSTRRKTAPNRERLAALLAEEAGAALASEVLRLPVERLEVVARGRSDLSPAAWRKLWRAVERRRTAA